MTGAKILRARALRMTGLFILSICTNCGELDKTSQGECAGDTSEYMSITDEDLLRP